MDGAKQAKGIRRGSGRGPGAPCADAHGQWADCGGTRKNEPAGGWRRPRTCPRQDAPPGPWGRHRQERRADRGGFLDPSAAAPAGAPSGSIASRPGKPGGRRMPGQPCGRDGPDRSRPSATTDASDRATSSPARRRTALEGLAARLERQSSHRARRWHPMLRRRPIDTARTNALTAERPRNRPDGGSRFPLRRTGGNDAGRTDTVAAGRRGSLHGGTAGTRPRNRIARCPPARSPFSPAAHAAPREPAAMRTGSHGRLMPAGTFTLTDRRPGNARVGTAPRRPARVCQGRGRSVARRGRGDAGAER